MNSRFTRWSIALPFFVLVLLTSGSIALSKAAELPQVRPDLALGTVAVLGPTSCPQGAATGAGCKQVRVSCAGLPDLDATLGVARPAGTATGTIVLVSGGPGITLLDDGFADTYVADGFNVLQFAWASDWASANGVGVKSAACRPASIFQFAFNVVHQRSRARGFCGQGISGGGAALAYALTEYGMSNYFDYVAIAAGPGVSRVDYGCDPPLYTGGPRNLCPLLTDAPFAYPSGGKIDGYEGTTTCAKSNPLPSDIARWTADSIVTDGATYDYPQTSMSWFFCATPGTVNQSTGQGSFLIDQVVALNPLDVNCYSGGCKGENPWSNKTAFNTTVTDMLTQCVPNH